MSSHLESEKGRQVMVTTTASIAVGAIVTGTVSGLKPFGAFVTLSTGQVGLVHISEVADAYVRDVADFLQEGQEVQVKVVSIESGKMSLSIKQAEPGFVPGGRRRGGNSGSFEDRMSKFLKDSEDRMTDLRRIEGKRGGRGGRHS